MANFDIDNFDQYVAVVKHPAYENKPVAIMRSHREAIGYIHLNRTSKKDLFDALPMDVWRSLYTAYHT